MQDGFISSIPYLVSLILGFLTATLGDWLIKHHISTVSDVRKTATIAGMMINDNDSDDDDGNDGDDDNDDDDSNDKGNDDNGGDYDDNDGDVDDNDDDNEDKPITSWFSKLSS